MKKFELTSETKVVFGRTLYRIKALIEEYLHLSTGYADETRELQDHLFHDIVSLGEQLYGQPV